ncbi:MAG TPA: MFS transporter [Firmicutes bacterium]|nr:MFS transporter [Bacillota bacterium]
MKNWSLKAVVLSISLLMLTPTAVSPAISEMISVFKDTDPALIKWVITLPSLVMVFFALIYGRLATFISKKTLTLVALICFFIGGVVPAFLNNFTMILAMRALFGVGIGFLMPLAVGLIADFFEGKELGEMMGYQSAVVNLGTLIFMFIAGLLAAVGWNYTFLVYSAGLFIAIWIFFKLPEPPRAEPPKTGEKVKMPVKVYTIILAVFLFNMMFTVIFTDASVMITGEGIGTIAQGGTVLTILAAGGLIGGLIFGKIMEILKKFTVSFGWLLTGLGMGTIAMSSNLTLISLGSALVGFGMAIAMPFYMILLSKASPPSINTKAFAYSTSLIGIGIFLSPIIFTQLINIFGKEAGRFPILISAIVLLVAGCAVLVYNYFEKSPIEAEVSA